MLHAPSHMLFYWPGMPGTCLLALNHFVAIKLQLQCHIFHKAFLIPGVKLLPTADAL